MNLDVGFQAIAYVMWAISPMTHPVWSATTPGIVSIAPTSDGNSAVITAVSPGATYVAATVTNPDGTTAVAIQPVLTNSTAVPASSELVGTMTFSPEMMTPPPAMNVMCPDGMMYPPGSPCPPYYEDTLDDWYPSTQSFVFGVVAYNGLQEVDINGFVFRYGQQPALQYQSNADGSISRIH